MKILWTLLCDNVITDHRTNNVSLIEIVEQINVPSPPPVSLAKSGDQSPTLLNMWLVTLWARSENDKPENGQARIKVVAPDGTESQLIEYEVNLNETPRSRAVGRIAGFPLLTQEGEHLFRVEKLTSDSDWQKEFELPVWVQIQSDSPSG